jgi:hypothetical protein
MFKDYTDIVIMPVNKEYSGEKIRGFTFWLLLVQINKQTCLLGAI